MNHHTLLSMAITYALLYQQPAPSRVLKLGEDDDAHPRRVISNAVELAEGVTRSWVTVTRTGKFHDPRYGDFEISHAMLSQMVRNFDAGAVGTDIFLDIDHKPGNGAAAKVLSLKVDNGRLRAQVEWMPKGIKAVREDGFRYLSAEFDENWQDNEHRKAHGCVLLGAGLTNRPVIKRLDPIQLAVASDPDFSGPVYVHPGLARQLTESLEQTTMNRWTKFLARLKAKGITLSEAQIASLKAAFEASVKSLAEDADDTAIADQFETVAKTLAQAGSTVELKVDIPAAAGGGGEEEAKKLSEAVNAAVTKALSERQQAEADAVKSLADVRKAYTDAIDAADGIDDAAKKSLSEAAPNLIGPQWTADQAKVFAEQQIVAAGKIAAARQLSALGFPAPQGVVQLTQDESNGIQTAAREARKFLAQTSEAATGELKLLDDDKLPGFAKRMLAEFDRQNARQLHAEAKLLAGGPVDTADAYLPASLQREVLREALSDLTILDLVDAKVEPTTSATHTIPYETRDTTDIVNDGVTFESQPIRYGGIKLDTDLAYINQVKLAMNLTNEVIFFTQNNTQIDWDAWARTAASNARIVREMTARRIANHLQHCLDWVGAVSHANQAVAAGTEAGTYKFASYPVVRPYQARDLKGNAVGAAETPLVVRDAGTPIAEYNGSGTQPAGNYYRVLNWNLGLLLVVNQAGVPQGGRTITSDYFHATNVGLFNIDVTGDETQEKHLNGLLRAVGSRKAILTSERYTSANVGLSSPILNDLASNAEQFHAAAQRPDAGVSSTGDLLPVKGIPMWSTNAPNLDMGDDRLMLFERGLLKYRVAKPFVTGAPFEAVDPATGRPIGRKVAYGEEYSSISVPKSIRDHGTSVIVYSAAARAAL